MQRCRPGRSSATTSAGSPTRTTCRRCAEARRLGGRDPHPARSRGSPDPEPAVRRCHRRCPSSSSPTGPQRARRPASPASGSWSTPVSTSARPSASRSSCCATPTSSRARVSRCSCRRRTSGSSATSSAPRSTTGRGHARGPRARYRARLSRPASPRRARLAAGGRRHGGDPRGPGRPADPVSVPVHVLSGDDPVLLGRGAVGAGRRAARWPRRPMGVVEEFAGDDVRARARADDRRSVDRRCSDRPRIVVAANMRRGSRSPTRSACSPTSRPSSRPRRSSLVWERPIGAEHDQAAVAEEADRRGEGRGRR